MSSNEKSPRRFTILVEQAMQQGGDYEVVICGIVRGEIRLGDNFYLISPTQQIVTSIVAGLKTKESENAMSATNCPVVIRVSNIKSAEEIDRFSVATNFLPHHAVSADRDFENGQLLGLAVEFNRMCQDPAFVSVFTYALCHSDFLVATYVKGNPKTDEHGVITLTNGLELSYPLVHGGPQKDKAFLPIFTDWPSLNNWKDVFNEEHPPRVTVHPIPKLMSIAEKMEGLVINPFGPVTLLLPNDYLQNIANTEGYKAEFGTSAVKVRRLKESDIDPDTPLHLDLPEESSELALVREELIAAAKANPQIERVFLLARMSNDLQLSYLCIVDCDKENERDLLENLVKHVVPYLHDVTSIEMAPRRILKMSPALAESSCIYTKPSTPVFNAASLDVSSLLSNDDSAKKALAAEELALQKKEEAKENEAPKKKGLFRRRR